MESIQNPTVIIGSPGFGLVGSIATEFLLEHLQMELIDTIHLPQTQPLAIVHKGKLIPPVGVYYHKEKHIVVVHLLAPAQGYEWELAQKIDELLQSMQAQKVIVLEGVQSTDENAVLAYGDTIEGTTALQEGIIMGITSTLLLKRPLIGLFAACHEQMPDSKAAAHVIEVLDKYLGLQVDYHPLLDAAKEFEEKLKSLMSKSQQALSEKEKRSLSYVG
ncbi:MAG: proteasome assembly chaperone family protein [Candidatus Woesearchaeota archaeon]